MKVAPDDPIYCTIDSNKSTKLARNCVSLENLEDITKLKNDLSYGNNLLQNYHFWPMMGGFGPAQLQQPPHYQFLRFPFAYYHHQHNPLVGCGGVGYGGFTHPYANRSNTNSKQSVGTSESDDYRKYRDVALQQAKSVLNAFFRKLDQSYDIRTNIAILIEINCSSSSLAFVLSIQSSI